MIPILCPETSVKHSHRALPDTDSLPRNVGKALPLDAAWYRRRTQISALPHFPRACSRSLVLGLRHTVEGFAGSVHAVSCLRSVRDMTRCLVVSAFASRPTYLLAHSKASVRFFVTFAVSPVKDSSRDQQQKRPLQCEYLVVFLGSSNAIV
jgi:hypothetical protein